jgi:hypothetical protein
MDPKPLAEASAFIERHRELWEANYSRLDTLLAELQAPAPKKSK